MKRRDFMALLGGAAVAPSVGARAQSSRQLPRIGVLHSGREGDRQPLQEVGALRNGLEALGWKEGRDIEINYRWPFGDPDRTREAARQLVDLSPAAIVSTGTFNLVALREATKKVPVVFVNVADPVAGGFVTSLARPGGNITGVTPFEYSIGGKWLQLLKEMSPNVERVAMLGEPDNPNFKGFLKSFDDYARTISVDAIPLAVRNAQDVDAGIGSLAGKANGGMIITAAAFSNVYRDQILSLANRYKLPAISWNRAHVDRGGLMSYGPNIADSHRQAAGFVDRILRGAKPEDLAVQAPVKIELIVNGKTAKALGLPIPLSILSSADEVIE